MLRRQSHARGAVSALITAVLLLAPSMAMAKEPSSCVILIHGLGRTYRSMNKMAHALEQAGFVPHNIDYPSRHHPIEKLAATVLAQGLARCEAANAATIHVVTHSMGGILLRYYLEHHRVPKLGRVVMLSPPNQGSEATDFLKDTAWYQWLNGPAGQQLGTGASDIPATLGPARFPVGVITGNRAAIFDGWLSDIIPGPDDGKVSVNRAKLAGMSDFLVLPYTHTFIMEEKEVIQQTLFFLTRGRFQRPGPSPATTP